MFRLEFGIPLGDGWGIGGIVFGLAQGVHLGALETDPGDHVQTPEIHSVHDVAGSDALDDVENVGIGIRGSLITIHVIRQVAECEALERIEVGYLPIVAAEIILTPKLRPLRSSSHATKCRREQRRQDDVSPAKPRRPPAQCWAHYRHS
jgi:hypothetical protein